MALTLVSCTTDFTTEPALVAEIQRNGTWRDTLTTSDAVVLEIKLARPTGERVVVPPAVWRSSDERVLQVEPLSVTGIADSAARDTLSARRTRIRVRAVGAGTATLDVSMNGTAGLAPSQRSFTIVVVPLEIRRVTARSELAVTQVDTITLQLASNAGGTFSQFRLNWRSTDESRVRVEPLAFTGNAVTDSLISRRLRVRAVALSRGPVELVVGIEGGGDFEVPELRLGMTVLPLHIVRRSWTDTMAVADSAHLQVEVLDSRNRPVPTASVVWASTDDASLRIYDAPSPGSPSTIAVTALRRDSVRLAVSVAGVAIAELAIDSIPVRIRERWIDLISGESWTCALSFDGRPYCWGGEVNGSDALTFNTTPTRIASVYQDMAVRFRRLRGGRRHACGESALTPGLWQCWGTNTAGQLGDGTRQSQFHAVPLFPGVLDAHLVAADFSRSCALVTDITQYNLLGYALEVVRCWGTVTSGVPDPPRTVAIFNAINSTLGTPGDASELAGATEVDVAEDHACVTAPQAAHSSFGFVSAACWGENSAGQLGNVGEPGNRAVPVQGSELRFHGIATANALSCALSPANTAYCWGSGFGATASPAAAGLTFTALVGVKFVSEMCGITPARTAYCWASGVAGPPVAQAAGLMVRQFAPSWTHRCVLREDDGGIFCWGGNHKGQVGLGFTSVNVAVPTRVLEPVGRQ